MELGALICTPRQPKCLLCPVQTRCLARAQGTAEKLPNLGERLRPTARRFIAFVVEHRGRFLVRQRPAEVVNAHFWEFLNVEISETPGDLIAFAREQLGLKLVAPFAFVTVKHSITRYRISLAAFRSTLKGQPSKNAVAERWLSLTKLEALAFTSAHRKILRKLIDKHEASAVTGVRAAGSTNSG